MTHPVNTKPIDFEAVKREMAAREFRTVWDDSMEQYVDLWRCCGGAYHERPNGHYADCPRALSDDNQLGGPQ